MCVYVYNVTDNLVEHFEMFNGVNYIPSNNKNG